VGNRGLSRVDNATEIDTQHVLPIGLGHVLELDGWLGAEGRRATAGHNSCIGPSDVELPEMVNRAGYRRSNLILLRDVGRDRDGVPALLLNQL
jgi:hypothetical protein